MNRPTLVRLRLAARLASEHARRLQAESRLLDGTARASTLLARACAWWDRCERLRASLEVAAGVAPDWSARVLVEA